MPLSVIGGFTVPKYTSCDTAPEPAVQVLLTANSVPEAFTDFIYGHAQAVFENCLIRSKESSHITAHAGTEPNLPTSYVFYNCRILTNDGVMTDLGRPWRPYAKVLYYNCWLDKGIKPTG